MKTLNSICISHDPISGCSRFGRADCGSRLEPERPVLLMPRFVYNITPLQQQQRARHMSPRSLSRSEPIYASAVVPLSSARPETIPTNQSPFKTGTSSSEPSGFPSSPLASMPLSLAVPSTERRVARPQRVSVISSGRHCPAWR